ncbi:MAG: tetratricopeptide repeat protein [Proteobacteria bacterium]|nr:tetratricopeptide repeat protein [Pseudomonadota bacterium]
MIPGAGSPVDMAYAKLQQGQAEQALRIIEPWARKPDATHAVLAAYAAVLKSMSRLEDSLDVSRVATRRFPTSGVAWHNYGSTLADLGRHAETKKAIDRAFSAGLDASETWLVYARAHQSLLDLEGAEKAFRKALQKRPDYVEAARDLAQLVWMRTEDADAAARVFDDAAWSPAMAFQKARLLKFAGLPDRALQVIEEAVPRAPHDSGLVLTASQLASDAGKFDRGLAYAGEALRRNSRDYNTIENWAGANLAVGNYAEALKAARHIVAMQPLNQSGIAVLATAARLGGGEEYEELYDYDTFVRPGIIEAPDGWASREAFLTDLSAALTRLHVLKTHPLEQSLRHGTQTTQDLRVSDEPAVQAFFRAIEPIVNSYMDAIGDGAGPLRQRNSHRYGLAGAWSVRLRPHGFHVDHIHPEGWLSSAFYVETPKSALDSADREGWIKFGAPGLPMADLPDPAHFVRPEPGKLVLFPSYMWHGTVPFTTDESRMTIAFDIIPA